MPCGRLSWLLVRFWAHVNIVVGIGWLVLVCTHLVVTSHCEARKGSATATRRSSCTLKTPIHLNTQPQPCRLYTVAKLSEILRSCLHFKHVVYNQPPIQLSLAIPPWVGAMISNQRAVMICGWGVSLYFHMCMARVSVFIPALCPVDTLC